MDDNDRNGTPSRRNFMRAAAGAAAAGAFAGCSGGGGDGGGDGGGGGTTTTSGGDGGDSGDGGDGGTSDGMQDGKRPVAALNHITYAWPEQEKKFESLTDISFDRTIVSYAGIQQKLFSGGNKTFDVAGFEGIIGRPALVFNDLGFDTPTSELTKYTEWNADNISDVFTRPTERLSHIGEQAKLLEQTIWADPGEKTSLNMVPFNYNFDSVGYNPKFAENVEKWSAMFDDTYKGKVALGAVPVISVGEAIMHLMDTGGMSEDVDSINNPSKDQIDKVIDFLIKEKKAGQFRALWGQAGRSAELMASEEAVVGNIWQPAVFSVRSKGTPCEYATFPADSIQGFALTTGGLIPTKPGAKDRKNMDEVRSYIQMHHGAWYSGFIQARAGYSVPHYPNKDLVRTGEDETGKGMGPEFYDWAYMGKRTYTPIGETQFESSALFQPAKYDWSMEEGSPASNGQKRDGGSAETRANRVGTWYTWPDEGSYLSKRWKEFTSA